VGGRRVTSPTPGGLPCSPPVCHTTAPATLLEKKKWMEYLKDRQAGVHLERGCCGCSVHEGGVYWTPFFRQALDMFLIGRVSFFERILRAAC